MSEECEFCGDKAVKIIRDISLEEDPIKVCEEDAEPFEEREDSVTPKDNMLSKDIEYRFEIQMLTEDYQSKESSKSL